MLKRAGSRSHARSRLATPWDGKDNLTLLQKFLRRHYRKQFKARHPKLATTDEAEVINSFVPAKCPYCTSNKFKKRAFTPNGIQRYQCSSCHKTFMPTTNTIFDSHRIAISEWIEYCLNLFRYVSVNADSWNNRNAFTTSVYWLQKLFLTLENIQDDIVLSDAVWLDETFYPVIQSNIKKNAEGNKLHGLSENQICIGVATDKVRVICIEEGLRKPSAQTTYETFKNHITPGAILIHDGDLFTETCGVVYEE